MGAPRSNIIDYCGGAENAGREIAGHENAGYEIAGHKRAGYMKHDSEAANV